MKQDFSGLSSGKFPGATKLQKVKSSSVVEVLQTINGILKKKNCMIIQQPSCRCQTACSTPFHLDPSSSQTGLASTH